MDAYGFPRRDGCKDAPVSPAEAQLRAERWTAVARSATCAGVPGLSDGVWGAGAACAAVDAETSAQINADVPRTFSESTSAAASGFRSALHRILCRFAKSQPELGYTQSLSDVAAVALLGLTAGKPCQDGADGFAPDVERDAYALCVTIARTLGDDVYSPTLTGVQVECRVLDALAERFCPRAFAPLRDAGVMLLPTTARWLLCLFAQDLPPRSLFGLWDLLLAAEASERAELLHAACLACIDNVPELGNGDLGLLGALRDSPAHVGRCSESLLKAAQGHARALAKERKWVTEVRSAAREEVEEESEGAARLQLVRALERSSENRFSRAELDKLLREFHSLGGKTITRDTFRTVLLRAAPEWSREQAIADAFFVAFDKDESGALDFGEVMLGLSVMCRGSLRERVGAVFRAIDLDRSGGITPAELLLVLGGTGLFDRMQSNSRKKRAGYGTAEEYVKRVFLSLDRNGDGVISEEEFERVVQVEPSLIQIFFASPKQAKRAAKKADEQPQREVSLLQEKKKHKCPVQ